MEMTLNNRFSEITENEQYSVVGGDGIIAGALAIVGYFTSCAVAGFNVGRQVVRDVRNKYFD